MILYDEGIDIIPWLSLSESNYISTVIVMALVGERLEGMFNFFDFQNE